jgi:thiol-disulfide isomerase/thioredoxin
MASFGKALSEGDFAAVTAHVHRLALATPAIDRSISEVDRLLADAGFTSLQGTRPPPITLTGKNGKTVKLSDFTARTLILHFWGTGCTHCIKEIPGFNELEKKHRGRLKVIHICTDVEDFASAQEVLDKLTPGTEAWVEADGIGLARFGIQTLPTVWLIGPDGTAMGRVTGARDWSSAPVSQLIDHCVGSPK